MSNPTIKLTMNVEFPLPRCPQYIVYADRTVDIADLTTAQLTAIGKAWTDALIRYARDRNKARRARKGPTT